MFSVFDSKVISFFQWTVRQVELYTSFSRKDIFFTALLCNIATISLQVINWQSKELPGMFWAIVYGVACGGVLFHIYIYYLVSDKKNTLPQAIISRKIFRVLWILLLLFEFIKMFIGVTGKIPFDLDRYIMVVLDLGSLIFLEYLLCTTSLPPRKKELGMIPT